MAAKHASLCRAKLTGRNADCECDASDKTRTKLMTPGEMMNRIDQLATEPEPLPRRVVPPRTAMPPIADVPVPIVCRRCSECEGQEHHWIENDDFEDEGDPEFSCKHCDALCFSIDDDGGLPVPSGAVVWDAARVQAPQPSALTEEQQAVLMGNWYQIVGATSPPVDEAVADKAYLDHIGSLVSDRSCMLVSLVRAKDYAIDNQKDRPIIVHQVCPACREAYAVTASDQPTELEAYASIGAVARRARLMHRCPEISAQLAVLSFADLQLLLEDLERDGVRALSRAQEVKAFADKRRVRETES